MNCDRRYSEIRTVELRTADKSVVLAGWPIMYNSPSELLYGQFREIIAPGTFDESLASSPDLLALVEHDYDRVLGRTTSGTLRVMPGKEGIQVEVDAPDTTYSRDLVESVRRGDIKGMSFSFDCLEDRWTRVDGIPQRTVLRAKVYEFSFTVRPAYTATDASVRSLRTWLASGNAGRRRRRLQLAEKC